MEKIITIKCAHCGIESDKPAREIKRQRKRGRTDFYCNRSCAGGDGPTEHLKEWRESDANKEHLKFYNKSHNRSDEYSDFRYHLNKARQRKQAVDLDVADLKTVWDEQEGKCALTKVKLVHSKWNRKAEDYNYAASLDRKDNAKGYVKGNIQFISVTCNWLKNKCDDAHVERFFALVVESRTEPVRS